jgi:CheY-like chemotaxis protein
MRVAADGEPDGQAVVRFTVEDTGIGLPPERLERVFDEYVPLDASPYRSFGITGLGLRISAELVRLMGGEIGAESQVGKGSRFWFRLPMAPAETPVGPRLVAPPDAVGGRILVVETDPASRERMSQQLADQRWHVDFVDNLGRVQERLRAAHDEGNPYQACVLSDYAVRPLHAEIASRIKWDETLASVALIMITAVGSPGDAKRLWHAGFAAYLRKPVPTEEFRDALLALSQLGPQGRGTALITRHSLAEARSAQSSPLDGIDDVLAGLTAPEAGESEPAPAEAGDAITPPQEPDDAAGAPETTPPAASEPVMAREPEPQAEAPEPTPIDELTMASEPERQPVALLTAGPPVTDAEADLAEALAPEVEADADDPILGAAILSQLGSASNSFAHHLAGSFLREAPRRIADLVAAATGRDDAQLLAAVRALRAMSGLLGAARLAAHCARAEADLAAGDLAAASGRAAAIEHAFVEVREALEAAAPPGGAPPAELPPIRAEFLDQLRPDRDGPSRALAVRLVQTFRAEASGRIADLRDAIAREDAAAVQRQAQTLKGMCSLVAAEPMAKLCALVEADARLRRVGNARRYVDQLLLEADRAFAAFDRAGV